MKAGGRARAGLWLRGRLLVLSLAAGVIPGVACDGGLGPPGAATDRVASLPKGAEDPRLDGDRVVFVSRTETTSELHALDLAAGQIETIDVEPGWIGGHDVSGERVAWFREGGLLIAQRRVGLTRSHEGWRGGRLDMDGDLAVFHGSAEGLGGILFADLETGDVSRISDYGGAPRLSGRHAAWIEVYGGLVFGEILGARSVIKLYDHATGDTTAIRNVHNDLEAPSIGPGHVVWSEANGEHDGGRSWDVRAYDIEADSLFDVATGPTFQLAIAVLEGHIAWLEDREPGDGRLAVHLLETATGTVRRVSDWGVSFVASDRRQILWLDDGRLVRFRLP